MAAPPVRLTAAKCPSCRIVLLRPVPGSSCRMMCPACNYHSPLSRQARPPTLLPTVEVTDTSREPQQSLASNFPPTSTSSYGLLTHESHCSPHRGQADSRDCPQPVDLCPVSPCSSSDDSNSPTQPSSWLPLPPPYPLGMGSIRRHSYQLIESQSASTPSRYIWRPALHGFSIARQLSIA